MTMRGATSFLLEAYLSLALAPGRLSATLYSGSKFSRAWGSGSV